MWNADSVSSCESKSSEIVGQAMPNFIFSKDSTLDSTLDHLILIQK